MTDATRTVNPMSPDTANTLLRLPERFDTALTDATTRRFGENQGHPPLLAKAILHAVLGGGSRVRPLLLLSVAHACGDQRPDLADRAAVALEWCHCASLAHDDLPAFDNADTRRGKPSVHKAYSEALAILAGDSLLMAAFESLTKVDPADHAIALSMIATLTRLVGTPHGVCAGQAWESEQGVDLTHYHHTKTAALFNAATHLGALAGGGNPEAWTNVGNAIGHALQLADDLLDAQGSHDTSGKPVGQDALHNRPSAVRTWGVSETCKRLDARLDDAKRSIPPSVPADSLDLFFLILRAKMEAAIPALKARG